jgi:hypothetical protein
VPQGNSLAAYSTSSTVLRGGGDGDAAPLPDYREAVSVTEDGSIFIRPAEVRDIQAFARIWDRNLKHQGFVDDAEAQAAR